jgi:heat shock protein HtpX
VAVALVAAAAGVAGAWWRSDAIALAVSHARPADPLVHARLHNLVEGLCIAAGLPKPRLLVVEDAATNAFSTGRDPRHAAVVVTTGLLDRLDRVELEGVLAHELSHIKSYDTRVSTLAVTLVGVATLVADVCLRFRSWGGPRHADDRDPRTGRGPAAAVAALGHVLLLVAPLVARVMQSAVGRRREALADLSGVALTRYPPGLIAALEKLQDETTVVHSASRATAHLWIGSPIDHAGGDRQARLNRRFDTSPPLSERIDALQEL